MTNTDKLQMEKWFKMVIQHTKENGNYIWPNEQEHYIIKGGKIVGSKSAINKIKKITTKNFHNNLVVSN